VLRSLTVEADAAGQPGVRGQASLVAVFGT
jgi:hypothetical protein